MTFSSEEENFCYELREQFRNYIKDYFKIKYNLITFQANQNTVPKVYYNNFLSDHLNEFERPYFTFKIAERIFFEKYEEHKNN